MKCIHLLWVQEMGVGMWTWGEEEDWEQLLEESVGTPVKDEEVGCAAALRGQGKLVRTDLSRIQGTQLHSFPPPWCMGQEGVRGNQVIAYPVLVLDRQEWKNVRKARDLELYMSIEIKMISGGTCRMKNWVIFMGTESRWRRTGERWMGRQIVVNKGNIRRHNLRTGFLSDAETRGKKSVYEYNWKEWHQRPTVGLGSRVPEESPAWRLMSYPHPSLEIKGRGQSQEKCRESGAPILWEDRELWGGT